MSIVPSFQPCTYDVPTRAKKLSYVSSTCSLVAFSCFYCILTEEHVCACFSHLIKAEMAKTRSVNL